MALQATVQYPRISTRKTRDKIHEEMSKAIVEALKSWVLGTTNVVPVWSGASKASFLKLAKEAQVSLTINPVAPIGSRIPLGIETSTGVLIAERGKSYGWIWTSDLDYIHIVDQRSSFLAAGERALRRLRVPELPAPVIEEGR